jgi:hypothetical protein
MNSKSTNRILWIIKAFAPILLNFRTYCSDAVLLQEQIQDQTLDHENILPCGLLLTECMDGQPCLAYRIEYAQ